MTNERSARPEDPPSLSVVMSAIIKVTKDKLRNGKVMTEGGMMNVLERTWSEEGQGSLGAGNIPPNKVSPELSGNQKVIPLF